MPVVYEILLAEIMCCHQQAVLGAGHITPGYTLLRGNHTIKRNTSKAAAS